MQNASKINFVVIRVAIIAALAGLLFGMDIVMLMAPWALYQKHLV